MQSAALLAASGKSRKDFGYIEHEARNLEFSIIKDLLFKGDHHGSVLCVVRNAMRAESYTQLLNAFDRQLARCRQCRVVSRFQSSIFYYGGGGKN